MEVARDDAVAVSRFKTTPLEHQLRALNMVVGRTAFAYLCEQGTGKTWMAINDAAALWGQGLVNGALVFAPNGVHHSWVLDQLPAHMPDWVRWRAVAWTSKTSKKATRKLESLFEGNDSTELRILTMNWEALQSKRGAAFARRFAESVTKLLLVGDESQRFKNPSAVRTKTLMKLRKHALYRRIMSGTPITNCPFDAFSQFTFLDETILRTGSYYAFKAEYAEMLQPGHGLLKHIARKTNSRRLPQIVAKGADGKPKYKNLDKLQELIAPHSFRVLKRDCLDLPEKSYTTSYFELSDKQQEAYELMEEQCRLVLADGTETPIAKLASIGKLSQIVSGFLIAPQGEREVMPIGDENPKMALLEDRLSDLMDGGVQVIVWARFREELRQIAALCTAQGWPHVEYHGDVSKDARIVAINEFQAGNARIFVAQQQVGGTGITLTAASHVIYYSNTFSAEDRWQSEDRAHRIGQRNVVTYEDFIALGTIDHAIVGALRAKKDVADIITGDALFRGQNLT